MPCMGELGKRWDGLRMPDRRRLLARSASSRPLAWILVLETAALRLVYPAAVVLLDHTWAALALAISTFSILLSLMRGWTADQLTRSVRAELFDSLSWAIENYPALSPPGSPPIEQLES